MNVGTLNGKTAEVNGTKTKSLRYRRAKYLIDSKRAGQGNNPYSALKFFLGSKSNIGVKVKKEKNL